MKITYLWICYKFLRAIYVWSSVYFTDNWSSMAHFDKSQCAVFLQPFSKGEPEVIQKEIGQIQDMNAKHMISWLRVQHNSAANLQLELQRCKEHNSMPPPSLLTALKNIFIKFIPYVTLLKDILYETSYFDLRRHLAAKSNLFKPLPFRIHRFF